MVIFFNAEILLSHSGTCTWSMDWWHVRLSFHKTQAAYKLRTSCTYQCTNNFCVWFQGAVSVDSITDLGDNTSRLLEALQLSHPNELDLRRTLERKRMLSLNPIYRQVPRIVDRCCQHIEAYGKVAFPSTWTSAFRMLNSVGWQPDINDKMPCELRATWCGP